MKKEVEQLRKGRPRETSNHSHGKAGGSNSARLTAISWAGTHKAIEDALRKGQLPVYDSEVIGIKEIWWTERALPKLQPKIESFIPVLQELWQGLIDDTWHDLEESAGLQFNQDQRDRIAEASTNYLLEMNCQENAANLIARNAKDKRAKPAKPIVELQKHLSNLASAFNAVCRDDLCNDVLLRACNEANIPRDRLEIGEMLVTLEHFERAISNHFKMVESGKRSVRNSSAKGSRTLSPPEYAYIRALAVIFEEAGGTIPKTIPTENTLNYPPFVQFFACILQFLPAYARHFKDEHGEWSSKDNRMMALCQTVYRALFAKK